MSLRLRNEEIKVYEVQPHWANLIAAGTWAFLGIFVLIGMLVGIKNGTSSFGGILMALLAFGGPLLWVFLGNKSKVYAITNQRVYFEEGVLSKTKLDIPFHKINDIHMSQSIVQRLFGAGNVLVYTGNSVPLVIKGIDNPNQFKEELFNIVSKTSKNVGA